MNGAMRALARIKAEREARELTERRLLGVEAHANSLERRCNRLQKQLGEWFISEEDYEGIIRIEHRVNKRYAAMQRDPEALKRMVTDAIRAIVHKVYSQPKNPLSL